MIHICQLCRVFLIDRFGNINTTVIGDYHKPTMRLPGTGGASDFISYAKNTILTMRGGDFVNEIELGITNALKKATARQKK